LVLKELKGLLVTLDHLSQEQRDKLALQAQLVIQEAKETQDLQALKERQDPQVLLAQQVLLEIQGLLDPQGQLE
jgi:hypothetical protein